jgi:hypothetical protein
METTTTTIEDELAELGLFSGAVLECREGGKRYLLLERVTLPAGCSVTATEALLCPQERDGYQTRLFLAQPVNGRGANWTVHRILDRNWHTWSWQGIAANQRLAQILRGHLRGLE